MSELLKMRSVKRVIATAGGAAANLQERVWNFNVISVLCEASIS